MWAEPALAPKIRRSVQHGKAEYQRKTPSPLHSPVGADILANADHNPRLEECRFQPEMLKSDGTNRRAEHVRHTTSMVAWSDLSRTKSVFILRHCWHTTNVREYVRSRTMSFSRSLLGVIRMRSAAPSLQREQRRLPVDAKNAMRCPGGRPSLLATVEKFSQML